jgi:dihydrofolate synthase/folylpolyglutamate synthase
MSWPYPSPWQNRLQLRVDVSYERAVAHLDALGIDAMKSMAPSLHRMQALVDALGTPQTQFPSIHITGTNGKTSVARVATAVLQETGLSVGTFTSPHLHTVRERIAHNGQAISEDAFSDTFDYIKPFVHEVERRLGESLTYFEILVGMFLLWATDAPIDVAVVEVGLGGLWDATNVVDGSVAVLTNVALDHTPMLGPDRLAIAKEKVGIIKDGSTVVTGERSPDVLDVITEAADAAHASLAAIDRDFEVADSRLAVGGRQLSIRTRARDYDQLFLPLHGSHQGHNAAVALEAVTSFLPEESLDDELVAQAFSRARVPGRMELIEGVMLDVAHNPTGMSAFVSAINEELAAEDVIFVAGFLSDKDYNGMLQEIARTPCHRLFATKPNSPRAVDPREIRTIAEDLGMHCSVGERVAESVKAAVDEADDRLVCVSGSHYVVGEARAYLLASAGPTAKGRTGNA